MAHLSIKRFTGAIALLISAQVALAHDNATTHEALSLPTHTEIFDLLMQQSDQSVKLISSCQSVGNTGSKTVQNILGYYLAVLSEAEKSRIHVKSHHESNNIRVTVNFEVVDDESPWNYGFQFNVNNHEGTWNAVDDSLICVGM